MKLEKVGAKPHVGRWVFLFILGLAVLGVMATVYNVEVIEKVDIQKVNLERLRGQIPGEIPWVKVILGSLGFFGILSALVLLFIRLLREMRVSQIQADFLDRISHELRTPLSTLTLVADLLKDSTSSVHDQQRLWRAHDQELTRIKGDVELLLQAARLRESKLKPELSEFNLEHWIVEHWNSFCQLVQPESSNGSSEFLIRTGPPLTQRVKLDATLLELILRNLLDNARKFSLSQTVEFRTVLVPAQWPKRLWSRKPQWKIEIIDQGAGFDPEDEVLLFRRFSRVPPKSQTRSDAVAVPGTGLGLYLSASASRAMDLKLRGVSQGEGRGAVFSLQGDFL